MLRLQHFHRLAQTCARMQFGQCQHCVFHVPNKDGHSNEQLFDPGQSALASLS